MANVQIVKCPTCKTSVALDAPDMPFCSDRCRLLDLGAWASGDYKISSPVLDPDLLEELDSTELRAELMRKDTNGRIN